MAQIVRCFSILFISFAVVFSMTGKAQENNSNLEGFDVGGAVIDQGYLDHWGIDKEEYKRFLFIKNNTSRSYFTPNANPLVYLGIEARTEKERRKYAEKMAQMEWENFEKVQRFSKSVQAASVRLFGTGDVIDLSEGDAYSEFLEEEGKTHLSGAGFNSRLLYVKDNCSACDKKYKELFSLLLSGEIAQVEVIFPHAEAEKMIDWAKRMKVDPVLNKRGVIVLRGVDKDEKVSSYPTVKFGLL